MTASRGVHGVGCGSLGLRTERYSGEPWPGSVGIAAGPTPAPWRIAVQTTGASIGRSPSPLADGNPFPAGL
jgi:hypothetical protein